MAARVMVIDAQPEYRAVIVRCIELAGGMAESVTSLGQGLRRLEGNRFDLVVWGVSPGERRRREGVAQLREVGGAPLIVVDEGGWDKPPPEADRVLPKPFPPRLLVEAVLTSLRVPGPTSVVPLASRIEIAGVVFDASERRVTNSQQSVVLTRREWELLVCLLATPNRWLPAHELLHEAWRGARRSPEQLRSYVARLRRKLGPLGLPFELASRQGWGYSFVVPKRPRA